MSVEFYRQVRFRVVDVDLLVTLTEFFTHLFVEECELMFRFSLLDDYLKKYT